MRQFLVPKMNQSHMHGGKLKNKETKKPFHQPLQGKSERDPHPFIDRFIDPKCLQYEKFHQVKLDKLSLKIILEAVIVCIIASIF